MTNARIGHGATMQLAATSGGALTTLEELDSLPIPNYQTQDIDATHLNSAGRVMEYISGLIDPGEGTFDFNLVPGDTTHDLLVAAQADGEVREYQITIPDGADGYRFSGDLIVKGIEYDIPKDNKMMASVTVRFTGAVTQETVTV